MKTKLFEQCTETAGEILRKGGLVAVPTETVYGLAANGMDASAVERLYEVKGRPAVKPLSLMVSSAEDLPRYASTVPAAARTLAERFWPGPLTLVLQAKEEIPIVVRAGGSTIGLRCPDHPLTLRALREAGVPFAAPSANPSGSPSPKTAEEVLTYFQGKIDAVIDGGPCTLGKESTILDLSSVPYRVLRTGALPPAEIVSTLVDAMQIIGITGTTGSGKSSALEALKEYGALVIDCDIVYHELLTTSEELLAQLQERFPGAFLSGELDRRALAGIVFSDEDALQDLNAITHIFVQQEVQRRLEQHAMAGGRLAAIDAVELISSGVAGLCDCTVAVLAPVEQRVKRIMERDGISEQEARRRITAQKSDEYYRTNCTFTVINDGSREEFLSEFIKTIREELIQDGRHQDKSVL